MRERLKHFRAIAHGWWALVVIPAWSAFWVANDCIEKWGSDARKRQWDELTGQLPHSWEAWLIGMLVIAAVFLVEGSFRYHLKHEKSHGIEIARLDKIIDTLREELRIEKDRSKPDFKIKLAYVCVAPASPPSDSIVFAIGTIQNLGGAGAVSDFWIDVIIDGKTVRAELTTAPGLEEKITLVKRPSGSDLGVVGAQHWFRTARLPIPHLSPCDGWLVGTVRGLSKEEIVSKQAVLRVTCADVLGNQFSGEYAFSGEVANLPQPVSELQSKSPNNPAVAEQVAKKLRGFS